jgi:hypothetical protein
MPGIGVGAEMSYSCTLRVRFEGCRTHGSEGNGRVREGDLGWVIREVVLCFKLSSLGGLIGFQYALYKQRWKLLGHVLTHHVACLMLDA